MEKGSQILITGKRSPKGLAVQEWEMVGPEAAGPRRRPAGGEIRRVCAGAPASEDLAPKKIREWAEQAVKLAPNAIEGLPAALRAKRQLTSVGSRDQSGALPGLRRGA